MDQREGLDAEAIADVLRKAMNLCSRQEKCAYDMRVWFSRKGIPPECIDDLVNTLISQNYIDDARYAEAYAREKTKLSQWGANRIAEMLRRKRIDERSIQRAMEAATAAYGKVNMEELMEKGEKRMEKAPGSPLLSLSQTGALRGGQGVRPTGIDRGCNASGVKITGRASRVSRLHHPRRLSWREVNLYLCTVL